MAVKDDLEGVGRSTGARSEQARQVMQAAIRDEECPFCPDRLADTNGHLFIQGGEAFEHWNVWHSMSPFKGTRHHIMLASVTHVTDIVDLPTVAREEFWRVIGFLKQEFDLDSYSLLFRLGDPRYNSATVYHLHAHVVVSDGRRTGREMLPDGSWREIDRLYQQLRQQAPDGVDPLEWIDQLREGFDILRAAERGEAYPIRAKLAKQLRDNLP